MAARDCAVGLSYRVNKGVRVLGRLLVAVFGFEVIAKESRETDEERKKENFYW